MKLFKKVKKTEEKQMTVVDEIKDIVANFETKQAEIEDLRLLISQQEKQANNPQIEIDEVVRIKSEQQNNQIKLDALQERFEKSLLTEDAYVKYYQELSDYWDSQRVEPYKQVKEAYRNFMKTGRQYLNINSNSYTIVSDMSRQLSKYSKIDKKRVPVGFYYDHEHQVESAMSNLKRTFK